MPEPWNAAKLGAVLSGACEDWLQNRNTVSLTSTANGTTEVYDVEEPDSPDSAGAPVILVRRADGARFWIESFVTATPLGPKGETNA